MKAFIHIDSSVKPVIQPYRRIPMALETQVIKKLEELLSQEIIEYVNEPAKWISPMVLVPKKDDVRICIDMRQANRAVMREHYPLPTFEELSHKLVGCSVFSKLDIKQAYHQLELDQECRYITTFITPLGMMRYKRLLFGLSSAPETFQRTMEFITRSLTGILVYIDDILVFGRTVRDHDEHLKRLLARLEYYNVRLNNEKCEFRLRELEFLGFHLSSSGVCVSESKVKAIRDCKAPKTAEELSSFLGLISYVSKYIPHLSTLALSLNVLTRKGSKYQWMCHHEEAFNKLKDIISRRESLALFDPNCPTFLFTDASPVGLGAVLVQSQNGQHRICAYGSKTLSDTERRYAQTEKEALAIVWGVERFHFFLFGIKFEIYTDHKPLTFIFSDKSKPCLRIERWVLRLQCYDYNIKYVTGKNNIADPLSRLNVDTGTSENNYDHCETIIHMIHGVDSLSIESVRIETRNDSELQEVIQCLQSSRWSKELWRYRLVAEELKVEDGILLRGDRIVIPRKLQAEVLRLAHEGHQGIVKTKRYLREFVWFPFMDKKAEEFVTDCFGCTLVSATSQMEPITSTELPSRPWKFLAIDFLGPLPSNDYVLVVVDYYSRFVEVEIMTTITASNTFKKLRRMFARFGYPEVIKSDHGPQFRDEFKRLCEQFDIKLIHSLPYTPHQNGEVERQNQGLLKSIRISQALGRDWKSDLEDYLLMYRSTPQMTTNKSPAELLFGRKIKSRLPWLGGNFQSDKGLMEIDRNNKRKGKERADKKAKNIKVDVGDTVVLKKFVKKHKIDTNFDPEQYEVLERSGTKVKLKNKQNQSTTERYIGHTKKVSSANPFLTSSTDVALSGNIKVPSATGIEEDQNTSGTLTTTLAEPIAVTDDLNIRPRRQLKKPAKMNDYQLYSLF